MPGQGVVPVAHVALAPLGHRPRPDGLLVDRRAGADVATVREATLLASPYEATMTHPSKAAQCFYMAEIVDRTVREVEANPRLWTFLRQAVEMLALADDGAANFHLVFTTRLCYLLGFRVDVESYEPGMMFDVSEGVFTRSPIFHPYYLQAESAAWLHRLLRTDFAHLADLRLGRSERGVLLDMMLTYLRIHMPEMGTVRSVEVLKTLYD